MRSVRSCVRPPSLPSLSARVLAPLSIVRPQSSASGLLIHSFIQGTSIERLCSDMVRCGVCVLRCVGNARTLCYGVGGVQRATQRLKRGVVVVTVSIRVVGRVPL